MRVAEDLAAVLAARLGGQGGLLVLRHSVRETIKTPDVEAAIAAPLTDEGRGLAWRLGSLLPARPGLRLFWSPVPRCKETAEMIAVGARGAGRSVELVGARDYLGAIYMLDPDAVTRQFGQLGQKSFLAAWLGGVMPPSQLMPPAEAGRQLLSELVAEYGRAPGEMPLDIHVTHDLTLITLLSLVCDVRADDFHWPGYLEGALLQPDGDQLVWSYGDLEARTWVNER